MRDLRWDAAIPAVEIQTCPPRPPVRLQPEGPATGLAKGSRASVVQAAIGG